jgi:poly(A) polymerase
MLKRIRALLGGGKGDAENDRPRAEPRERSVPAYEASGRPPIHKGPKVVHRPIERHHLDPDAVKIVQRLTRFEHTAYLVGGCVRDALLDRKPKDFDIGTSATPRQIKRVFRNCRIIGRRFRLAHIYFQNGKIIEVATFRALDEPAADDAGDDSRDLMIRDDNVFGTPEEDALRRDFTINQLFYDLGDDTVIDHAGGLDDLRRRLVRTIGEPERRFREDPIRSLRAIKFAARLDFDIEKATLQGIRSTRQDLHKAAPPRVLEEINRFCRGGAARRSFELLKETDVLDVILPEIAKGCGARPESWSLLIDLLRRMDVTRFDTDREIRTGEILAVLLLPVLTRVVGWVPNEAPPAIRALEAREMVEENLRSLAQRLRVPRREQEYCRQILTTLFRMVPAKRVRPNTRRSVVARDSFSDALWILDVASAQYGDAFVEARDFWRGANEAAGPAQPRTREKDEGGSGDDAPRRSRRRRSRRGGAGQRGRGEALGETEGESQSATTESGSGASSSGDDAGRGERTRGEGRSGGGRRGRRSPDGPTRPDMPPPWDDNYFFAALPSADDAGAAAEQPVELAEPAEPREDQTEETDAIANDDARPRRRRRRRRRGRRSPDGTSEDADGDGDRSATNDDKPESIES